ncbi:MAG: hypothetical protein V7K97_24745 [Nostoc sp.]
MRVVFADTGYWVALLNPRDDLPKIWVKAPSFQDGFTPTFEQKG